MAGKETINAFLGAGAVFEGQLAFKGMVRIDCAFTGSVNSDGVLVLGELARVEGEINVEQLISNGIIIGNVTARSKVTLQKNSQLQGNLTAPYLDVEEGAVLEGQVVMKRDVPAQDTALAQSVSSAHTATSEAEDSWDTENTEAFGTPDEAEEASGGKKKGWFSR